MSSTFQRRHFKAIAETLNKRFKYVNGSKERRELVGIVEDMCQLFKSDNYKFDKEKFIRAVQNG